MNALYFINVPTLSLWDGLQNAFDMIGSFFTTIWDFISQAVTGILLTLEWMNTAIPINFLVVNSMPHLIVAACTLTIGILVLRTIFGFWIGGG